MYSMNPPQLAILEPSNFRCDVCEVRAAGKRVSFIVRGSLVVVCRRCLQDLLKLTNKP